ncbi:uncharacterized protein BX663DRAFT_525401 [Cokeromyces recurvatus]|uniref:uncharacterized protein n=1 Tax=Cokeromyces recurvatus TaxID=90255 RepID=UPI00221E8157|nr:uncharacterized protein BX663DRAFT_525401 [Cokeromyces recurvatus]KAI7898316.1 hypothetical protein BX663DRAFT_525401 [Cokeromyces recurvatus]
MIAMSIEQSNTSPKLSTILNKDEYLPTPVTPVSEFPQYKKDTKGYGSFSVIKPPLLRNSTSSPTEAKPYPCPECHQTFSRPHNLKSHLTTHSSERPFQCDVCNHHFRRHHDLKRHQKLHTGERPYVCEDCYRSFARLDALNRHRRAEGGTACSAVHQQVKQQQESINNKKSNVNKSNNTTIKGTTASSRPVIPQLHIPNPASHPITTPSSISSSVHSPAHSSPSQLLPSPNTLPNLPITSLSPIYRNTSNSPPLYHPYPQPWSRKLTLPPISSSSQHGKYFEQLHRENEELKRDIDQLRAMAQREASLLKSRIHDLEVENKVLRSLIQNGENRESNTIENSNNPIAPS